MAGPETTLTALIGTPQPDPAEIAACLDGAALGETIAAVRSLGGTHKQGQLWDAVAANERLAVADLVPVDYPRETPVVFHGKNSLPAFTEFEKICFRPDGPHGEHVLWGYNEGSTRAVIGPGYYVLHDTDTADLGGAAFDYTRLPERGLGEWPRVRRNEAGLSRFVYAGMIDYMRRVSRDVFIGQAVRRGKPMGSYFVLARELA